MGFKESFSKFGKSVQNTAGDISDKAKLIADKTKIKSKISTEESTINTKYMELGKKAYELFKEEQPNEEVTEIVRDIETSFSAIKKLNNELISLNGIVKCTACDAEILKEESFCSKCGAKRAESQPVYEPEEAEIIPTETTEPAEEVSFIPDETVVSTDTEENKPE